MVNGLRAVERLPYGGFLNRMIGLSGEGFLMTGDEANII
jgi:hypothetical protein